MSNAAIPFLAAKDSPEAAEWVGALRAAMPDERIVTFEDLNEEARSEARLAIVANPDPADLRRLPKLCWVHSVWAGVERLLADPENSRLHIVRLLDPQLAATMAEAVLAWTLFLHREMPAYARQQAQQLWQPRPYTSALSIANSGPAWPGRPGISQRRTPAGRRLQGLRLESAEEIPARRRMLCWRRRACGDVGQDRHPDLPVAAHPRNSRFAQCGSPGEIANRGLTDQLCPRTDYRR
jgi:hypothetical protein